MHIIKTSGKFTPRLALLHTECPLKLRKICEYMYTGDICLCIYRCEGIF